MTMRVKTIGLGLIVTALMAMYGAQAMAKEPPVAKLVQVEGVVEYSRNGTRWNAVRSTKYLFPGYRIRTGADGGGKLINQSTGESQELGSNSEIQVADGSIKLITGRLSEPEEESTSLFQSLMNKFAKAQRYTTVRRSVTNGEDAVCDNKVRTIRSVSLSPSHPELVWRNACPEFSYRLVIDGAKAIEVPAQSTSEMIRYEVSGISAGEHIYRVEVLDKDGTVYIPRNESKFVWLSAKDEKAIVAGLEDFDDDVFMATNYLEDKGLYVAAMDLYRDYFMANPDDNDMRPFLIQSYQDLKLSNLRENEARLYNAALEEDY
jgi:hypothetical protein